MSKLGSLTVTREKKEDFLEEKKPGKDRKQLITRWLTLLWGSKVSDRDVQEGERSQAGD